MLFEPYCFIQFLENNGVSIIEYIDNWADDVHYYFFEDDLVIDMRECIHIEVAKMYLRKIHAEHLTIRLSTIDCPCLIDQ